jgi:arginine decarboxylase-like protein
MNIYISKVDSNGEFLESICNKSAEVISERFVELKSTQFDLSIISAYNEVDINAREQSEECLIRCLLKVLVMYILKEILSSVLKAVSKRIFFSLMVFLSFPKLWGMFIPSVRK